MAEFLVSNTYGDDTMKYTKRTVKSVSVRNILMCKTIQGVRFYFDRSILSDQLLRTLESFAIKADDEAYCVYFDDEKIVIF